MDLNVYQVGIYIRLSKEDEDHVRENSESVLNQRSFILRYLKEQGLSLAKEYIDDGYSGTTFDRPGFQALLDDIEAGRINMVVTKDLSRLGRDYIKSGYYVEEYFPKHHVRYVSLLDGVDTFSDSTSNEIAPFKALFNDMVSKDTSKKIRSILKNKKEQGLFLGSSAPYGYRKSKEDKHRLEVDPISGKVVKDIFDAALSGKSCTDIALDLNHAGVLTPVLYKGAKVTSRMRHPEVWTASTVYAILHNPEYQGCLVQHVWTNLSYKNKTRIKRDAAHWVIAEKTHEPLVSKEVFQAISKCCKKNQWVRNREKLLLEGLIYCKDCGCLLGASYQRKRAKWVLNCNRYRRNSKLKLCFSHAIDYCEVEEIVVARLKKFLNELPALTVPKRKVAVYPAEKRRKVEQKLEYLYQDRLAGIISVEKYLECKKTVEKELEAVEKHSKTVEKEEEFVVNPEKWQEIDRELAFFLIDKIFIDGEKTIEIVYSFKEFSEILS